jgi:hypothetical protein
MPFGVRISDVENSKVLAMFASFTPRGASRSQSLAVAAPSTRSDAAAAHASDCDCVAYRVVASGHSPRRTRPASVSLLSVTP